MVSPSQHHQQLPLPRLDDIDDPSQSVSDQSRLFKPAIMPPVLGDHQSENSNQDIVKSTGKRKYDELTKQPDDAQEADGNNNNTTNTIDVKELHVLVKPAQEWHEDRIEDYKMSSRKRGHCLIINNVTFENNVFPARKGSDKDAWRLKKIFEQFGFEVDCKRNVTSEKMANAFKQKAALCMNHHDALVVILLSHGSEQGVYGIDGIEMNLNDVLTYFDNKRCKTMRQKPKIFIVQACRGRMVDYGVQNTTQFLSQPDSQSLAQFSQLTQSSQVIKLPQWGELDQDHNPIRTDMVLCFSTQTGYVSHRNEEEGSWLGSSLATHLCREAHKRHFMDILNMVSRDIRKLRSSCGLKQVLEVTTIGFDKNLYFNPGLFK